MATKQTIIGRGRNRLGLPDSAVGYGFSAGTTSWVNTFFNYQGLPIYTPSGKPTGYPVNPSGFSWAGNLIWNNPPNNLNADPGCLASAVWIDGSPTWTQTTEASNSINSGLAGNAINSTSNSPIMYAGPQINCNLKVVATTNASGFGKGTIMIIVSQDGTNILDTGFIFPSGTFNYPFIISATAGSQITVSATCRSVSPTFPPLINFATSFVATLTP